MKIIIIIAILTVTVLCRLSSTSSSCQLYLNKFDHIVYDDYIVYNQTTSQIIVTFGYYDELFFSEKYFGLTSEDGKEIESTCLDLQFFVFTSQTKAELFILEDKNLTRSNITDWRFLSFTIQEQELKSQINQNSNSQFMYTVYYSVMYTIHDTKKVHHVQQFNFTILLSSSQNSIFSFPQSPIIYENSNMILNVDAEMKWCTDIPCTNNTIPSLYTNDKFFIQQTIISPAFSEYYLTNTSVKIQRNELNREMPVIFMNNSIKGKTLLLLQVPWFSFDIIDIIVESFISFDKEGNNQQVVEQKYLFEHILMICNHVQILFFIFCI